MFRRCRANRSFAVSSGGFAPIDDILVFGQYESSSVVNFVTIGQENQRLAFTFLRRDIGDARDSTDFLAHLEVMVKLESAARPHSTRQRHRWQKRSSCGMAIDAKLTLASDWLEQHPVPKRRDIKAYQRFGILSIESRTHRSDSRCGELIGLTFSTPNPLAEVLQVHDGAGRDATS